MSLKIVTDSTCALTQEEAKELNVTIVPLTITFGEKSYRDGVDLTHEEFCDLLLKCDSSHLPKTSSPAPMDFVNAFEEAKSKGDEVLGLFLSSKLSATYQTALMAKDMVEYDKIHIFDTLSFVGGLKILILEARRLEDEMSIDDLVAYLDKLKDRIRIYAAVDTLEYMYKGGRLSKLAYALGSILAFKPVCALKEGKIAVCDRARGSKAAIKMVVERTVKHAVDFNYPIIFGYSYSKDKMNEFIQAFNENYKKEYDYATTPISSVITTHVGPNCIAIFYIREGEGKPSLLKRIKSRVDDINESVHEKVQTLFHHKEKKE